MAHTQLWAPWRMAYLKSLEHQADAVRVDDLALSPRRGAASVDFIAEYFQQPRNDEPNLVVYRTTHGLIMLNRYPYATGHLMAALGEPRSTLLEYASVQRAEFWKLVELAMDLVHRALRPQGMNVGINEGRAAGAGLPEHLHAHIVPRWGGDTNFMSVVGEVRVIPESLEAMAQAYRQVIRENGYS